MTFSPKNTFDLLRSAECGSNHSIIIWKEAISFVKVNGTFNSIAHKVPIRP